MAFSDFIHDKAIELGKDAIRMTTAAGSGHPTSSLSIIHIVTVLMHDVMNYDPADPWNPGNDRLVLSEGHAVPAVYAAYADVAGVVGKSRAEARVLKRDELVELREVDSVLDGHPNPAEGFPFFDAATGSLGQGLSVAAGLALAARQRKIDKKFYTIIGDGESREGQIWEAMDFIAENKLTNVVAIFNCNGHGQAGHVSVQQSADTVAAKAMAFGWNAMPIDGHNPDSVREALINATQQDKPTAIIAKTTKGWGCPTIQDVSNHGKPVPSDKLDAMFAELDSMRTKLNVNAPTAEDAVIGKPAAAVAMERKTINAGSFDSAMRDAGFGSVLEKKVMATRRAYGAALLALAKADPRIVALDGDVSNSTFAEVLGKAMPDRFFECKIAEQHVISAAAGMAAGGFVPFASSFAKFISRAYDQIEMAQITRANIKIVGSHAGISLAADGPSQMSLHDVAFFRSATRADNGNGSPASVSFQPADAVAAFHCTVAMANHEGMCYMRTHRPDVPFIYDANTEFNVGGFHTINEGDDITIISAGYMIHPVRDVIAKLAGEGVKCKLIDAYSFPFDESKLLAAANNKRNRILTVEDNYIGGLAGAVAEAAARAGTMRVDAMTCDRIPKSAKSPESILEYTGLSPAHIEKKIRSLLG